MSILLLENDANHQHGAFDDLESVFWLLCYCLLRYTNLCSGPNSRVQDFMHSVFDNELKTYVLAEGQSEQRKGGGSKKGLLQVLESGYSLEMQPVDLEPGLRTFFADISASLLYHVDLHNLERLIRGDKRELGLLSVEDDKATIAVVQNRMKGAERKLKKLKNSEPDELFGYASLKDALEAAITSVRECEATFASSAHPPSAPRGSLRVDDRHKEEKTQKESKAPAGDDDGTDDGSEGLEAVEAVEGAEDGSGGERSERRTVLGSVKRGSLHEEESSNKVSRPSAGATTPTRARSGHSASGSYRAELATIMDMSPLKAKSPDPSAEK